MTANVDASNNAFFRIQNGNNIKLLKVWDSDGHISIDQSANGGSSWNGTKILTNADIQAGRVSSIDCAGNSMATYNVTFPIPFYKAPQVVVSLYSNTSASGYGNVSVMSTLITTTGFQIKVANANNGSFAPGVCWIAY